MAKPTILIQAPVFSRSGYGQHSRDIILALFNSRKYNVSVAATGWGGTSTTDNLPQDVMDILTFVCNNPVRQDSEFTFVHVGIPSEFRRVSRKRNIGITAGIEATGLPPGWADNCNQMDAIIVPSTFLRTLFIEGGVTVPVHAVGEGVDTSIFNPNVEYKLPISVSTTFNFLCVGQWMQQGPGEDRKGIGLLLQLFAREFEKDEHVGLVLKATSINSSSPDSYFTRNRLNEIKAEKPFPKIYLVHGDMNDNELAQLYRGTQAFVMPTSGEGWGRPILEAASCDLPILVTGWSGHMDFVDGNYATLFDYKLGQVPRSNWSQGLFQPTMQWAFPDPEDIVRKMRRCVEKYDVAKERAVKLGEIVRTKWSRKITDEVLVKVFDSIIFSGGRVTTGQSAIGIQQI